MNRVVLIFDRGDVIGIVSDEPVDVYSTAMRGGELAKPYDPQFYMHGASQVDAVMEGRAPATRKPILGLVQ